MTIDEQRAMWREYVRMLMPGDDDTIDALMRTADALLAGERKRFDQPSHAGDADTMVEPKPWVGLTGEERRNIVNHWMSVSEEVVSPTPVPCDFAHLAALVEARLRYKNEGTR